MSKPFEGTIMEGFENKFTVIKNEDVMKYALKPNMDYLKNLQNYIGKRRQKEGKVPSNSYIVINLDEPYIDEIVEIMKRHGHWG